MVNHIRGRWWLIFFAFPLLFGSLFPVGMERVGASTNVKQITGLKLSEDRIVIRSLIVENDFIHIKAYAVYDDNTTEDISSHVKWEFLDDEDPVFLITEDGGIAPLREGKGTVTVRYLDFKATAQIEINLKTNSENVEWEEHYTNAIMGTGTYVEQTKDGGYILAGSAETKENYQDHYIAKTNKKGTIEWSKTLGKKGFDYLNCVRQTKDGGYIAVGSMDSSFIYVVKLTSKGKVQWEKTFTKNERNEGYSVQQTSDGGYILAGATGEKDKKGSDFHKWSAYLLKINSSGKKQWEQTFSQKSDATAQIVIQTKDKGYLLIGGAGSDSIYSNSPYMVKVDSKGTKEWEKVIEEVDYWSNISGQLTKDGGYLLHSNNAILKLDSKGNVSWVKKIHEITGNYDFLGSLVQMKDGGFILAMNTSEDPEHQVRIVKLDSSGQKKWIKDFGSEQYDYYPTGIKETKDKGYIIVGQVKKEFDEYQLPFLMKFTKLE